MKELRQAAVEVARGAGAIGAGALEKSARAGAVGQNLVEASTVVVAARAKRRTGDVAAKRSFTLVVAAAGCAVDLELLEARAVV